MTNIMEWIRDFLLEFWPIRIIDAGSLGVLWKQNGTSRNLQPGLHWFIPKLQRIEEVAAQYQNQDCGVQSLTTKDGKEIQISLNVGYRVADAAALYREFQHFDTSLINMARGHCAEVVCDSTWQELMEDPLGIAQEIQESLVDDLKEDIVLIEDVTADQLSKARTFRLLQTQSL